MLEDRKDLEEEERDQVKYNLEQHEEELRTAELVLA